MQYQSLVYDNASNSNEQHDMEINSARVAAEEDVANNSKDLFEHFDVTRKKTQNFRIQSLISALRQMGQSSNSNDVKVGNKKHAPMKKQTPISIQPQDTSVERLIRDVTSEKFWHHPVVTLRVITLETYAKVMIVIFGMKFDIGLIASTSLHELFV
ncbi:hypothetical protein Ahy_A09g044296 [Arachis hypogaea]|uniref:Uncharacterized protein n=1 Tax=Arachis hypogaea TaxID=3818 RepID=A0A445BJV1_ARAHY|nr:hypothetical protein Ahy_A09g044296 [Arachis hypogaea]